MNPWDTVNPITRVAAEQERLEDAERRLQLYPDGLDRALWETIARHAASEVARWERMIAEIGAQK